MTRQLILGGSQLVSTNMFILAHRLLFELIGCIGICSFISFVHTFCLSIDSALHSLFMNYFMFWVHLNRRFFATLCAVECSHSCICKESSAHWIKYLVENVTIWQPLTTCHSKNSVSQYNQNTAAKTIPHA